MSNKTLAAILGIVAASGVELPHMHSRSKPKKKRYEFSEEEMAHMATLGKGARSRYAHELNKKYEQLEKEQQNGTSARSGKTDGGVGIP